MFQLIFGKYMKSRLKFTSFYLLSAPYGNRMETQVATESVQDRRPFLVLDPIHTEIQHLSVAARDHRVESGQILKLATLQVTLMEDPATLRFRTLSNHSFPQKDLKLNQKYIQPYNRAKQMDGSLPIAKKIAIINKEFDK